MGTLLVTTSGAGTWTVPAGVTSVDAECWGAGSGGGFNLAGTQPGGGGGAYSKEAGLATTPGDVWTYAVGAGGSALGGGGGSTQFANPSSIVKCLAVGGSSPVNGSTGGVGGLAASGTGTIKHSGGSGWAPPGLGGGGGGSSAGTAADGTTATSGTGAVAPSGGGNGGNGGAAADALPGNIPGGAGGGCDVGFNAAPGANGKLLLTWADPAFSADMVRSDETIDVAAEVVCRALQKQVIAY